MRQNWIGDTVCDFKTLKGIVDTINYLKSLKPKTLDEVRELVSEYNTDGEGYSDFYYDPCEYNFCIESCFCKNNDTGLFELSRRATILDDEQNVILEIEEI